MIPQKPTLSYRQAKINQNEQIAQKARKLLNALKLTTKEVMGGIFSSLWTGYQADEALLIQLMNGPGYPTPATPGNLEYSWVLYFLNVELPASSNAGADLQWLLTNVFDMPGTNITSADWTNWEATWEGQGVLLGDGTLVSTQVYAVMDPDWAEAVLDYLSLQMGIETLAPFNTEPNTITVDAKAHTVLNIAVMGDWGTGNYTDGSSTNSPSYQVMAAIKKMAPDMVVHLGDVYYAGSATEEQAKLLNEWQYNAPLGNFTLNSNHEMYSGGTGYFNTALSSSLFASQVASGKTDPTSYFAINYGNWVILGLDSAYNATGDYMQGRITDAYQPGFIASAATAGKKVMVFTHHNPIDLLGQNTNPLWTDITGSGALNVQPDIWYWGHIHNGIVYNSTAASGKTLARCLGNGGIPYGNAPWLSSQNTIDFYCSTALGDPTPCNALRVKNAFAIISIKSDGTVTETWYDQDGNTSWTN